MKTLIIVAIWVIDHWYLWGALFGATGLAKLLVDKWPMVQ